MGNGEDCVGLMNYIEYQSISVVLLIILVMLILLLKIRADKLKDTQERLTDAMLELSNSEGELQEKYHELMYNEMQLRSTKERYKLIVEANNDGIWDYDLVKNKRFQSERFLEKLGYKQGDFDHQEDWDRLIHINDIKKVLETINQYWIDKRDYYECEYRLKDANNKYIWIKERGKALFDKEGNPYRMAGSYTDISELKDYEKTLETMAQSDILTGLPNRRYLEGPISKRFEKQDSQKAMFFLDIDNFKIINDSLGHAIGDKAIGVLCERLFTLTNRNRTLCRLEGDELVFYMDNIEDKEIVEKFAHEIKDILKIPFELEEGTIHMTVSIGIARYPEDGSNIQELLMYSDLAMYKAKEFGKNRYEFFEKKYLEEAKEVSYIEKHLRDAIDKNEFVLYYQPKVDIVRKKVVGFEALIRWESSELGFVAPDQFIKIAENSGLIIPIGEWVLKEACRFIKRINEKSTITYGISINVSAVQLMQENFVEEVLKIIREIEVDYKWIELEITETTLIKSSQKVNHRLETLREKGIAVALDDFGKEYSSISYLRNLSLDTLKIDKAFIDDIKDKNDESSIIDIIIGVANKMGLSIVAEGVETEDQLEYLKRNQCTNIQGYIFSRPVPEKELLKVIYELDSNI